MKSSLLVISSQLCESKPTWLDDNGREACWKELGVAVIDGLHPLGENEWFDENDAVGVLWISYFVNIGGGGSYQGVTAAPILCNV